MPYVTRALFRSNNKVRLFHMNPQPSQARLRTNVAILLLSSLTIGCTTLEPPLVSEPLIGYDLVDLSLIDTTKYTIDHKACVEIANQNLSDVSRVATRVLSTAADRASLGIIGQRASKDADRVTVLKRCLSGRGYVVLR
jgi:hypothetical protein